MQHFFKYIYHFKDFYIFYLENWTNVHIKNRTFCTIQHDIKHLTSLQINKTCPENETSSIFLKL